jgi:hypothetical protein
VLISVGWPLRGREVFFLILIVGSNADEDVSAGWLSTWAQGCMIVASSLISRLAPGNGHVQGINLPKKLESDDESNVSVCLLLICLLLIFLCGVLVKSSGEKYGERYVGLLGWLWRWLWVLREDCCGRL